MNYKLHISLLIIITLLLGGVTSATTTSILNVDTVSNEVEIDIVFSIPIGDDGINYASKNNPDEFTWGPPAFTIAPDGTFWIADTVDNRLLHYSTEGEFLDKISIGDFVLGAGDLEVTSNEIWVLDKASSVPKVAHFTLDGKFINSFDLPDGLRQKDGLTGITIGSDGSLLIELEGGLSVVKYISPSAKLIETS